MTRERIAMRTGVGGRDAETSRAPPTEAREYESWRLIIFEFTVAGKSLQSTVFLRIAYLQHEGKEQGSSSPQFHSLSVLFFFAFFFHSLSVIHRHFHKHTIKHTHFSSFTEEFIYSLSEYCIFFICCSCFNTLCYSFILCRCGGAV